MWNTLPNNPNNNMKIIYCIIGFALIGTAGAEEKDVWYDANNNVVKTTQAEAPKEHHVPLWERRELARLEARQHRYRSSLYHTRSYSPVYYGGHYGYYGHGGYFHHPYYFHGSHHGGSLIHGTYHGKHGSVHVGYGSGGGLHFNGSYYGKGWSVHLNR